MAMLVEAKALRRSSLLIDPETPLDSMSATDRLFRERLQRYCMLLAKEREVLQKLERARRASTAGLQWMDSDSSFGSPRSRTSSVDSKGLGSNERIAVRKSSTQGVNDRRTSLIESKPMLRRLSQPAQFPSRSSTPSFDRTNSPEPKPHCTVLRKKYCSPTDLTSTKIRVLESQRKTAQRMQRMQSLDEDCEKAKQLMKKYKSVSLSRLDMIGSRSDVPEEKRKAKSKSWLV